MTDPEDIQRLIRLKRHELPPEGFMEDFMAQLHERQRADVLRQSAFSLLWERIGAYLEGRTSPNMGLAAAAAVVALGGVVWWMPHEGATKAAVAAVQSAKSPTASATPVSALAMADRESMFIVPQLGFEDQEHPTPTPARLGEMLLSQHFRGGYADEARARERESHGVTPVNLSPTYNQGAPLDLAEPLMQQNGSAGNIQKLGQ